MKKILLGFIATIVLVICALWISGYGFILTAISRTYLAGHPTANIDDYKTFDTRLIESGEVQEWPLAQNYEINSLPDSFAQSIKDDQGIAFLVVKDGKLMEEQYFNTYNPTSKTNSFSMAKTLLTMLVGIAIQDGYIESLDQKLVDFLPEYKEDEFGKTATIGSLSRMTSGYDWDESYYSPFSPTVELYYGNDVKDFLLNRSFAKAEDTEHYYSSASTQLLAIVLSRALQKKNPYLNLSIYLSDKLWIPLGMDSDALWHLDNQGMELAYCCVNTNARNFAKLGQLLLQNGKWNNIQIIDSNYVALMHTSDMVDYYGYSTWIQNDNAPNNYYYFRGHLGQYIIIVPNQNMVIVRLGQSRGYGSEASLMKVLNNYVNEMASLTEANKAIQ
jgi:CubicO group peptidase (beta-lactamase class C family)